MNWYSLQGIANEKDDARQKRQKIVWLLATNEQKRNEDRYDPAREETYMPRVAFNHLN